MYICICVYIYTYYVTKRNFGFVWKWCIPPFMSVSTGKLWPDYPVNLGFSLWSWPRRMWITNTSRVFHELFFLLSLLLSWSMTIIIMISELLMLLLSQFYMVFVTVLDDYHHHHHHHHDHDDDDHHHHDHDDDDMIIIMMIMIMIMIIITIIITNKITISVVCGWHSPGKSLDEEDMIFPARTWPGVDLRNGWIPMERP